MLCLHHKHSSLPTTLKCTEDMFLAIKSSKQSKFQTLTQEMPFLSILLDVSVTGNCDRSPVPPEKQAIRARGRGAERGTGRGLKRCQDPVEPHIDWFDKYTPMQMNTACERLL